MLTLAIPQSEPARRQKALGLLQVLRENAGRKPLRHCVVQRQRLAEMAVRQDVENRREGLLHHDGRLLGHFDDGRTDIKRIGIVPPPSTRPPPVTLPPSLLA